MEDQKQTQVGLTRLGDQKQTQIGLTKTQLKDENFTKKLDESPRELVRRSEVKRKQAPQSEANVCRQRKYNLEKPPLLIAHDNQQIGVALPSSNPISLMLCYQFKQWVFLIT